jgi:hypothetical protein
MLKKKIIFGSVVLLLAALFALTGCSQATDSDGGTTVYSENHLFGTATPDDVARAVASAKASGRSVVLTDQTTIVGVAGLSAVADFGDRPVRVEGQVYVDGTTNPVIVNAARANLTFEPNARIDLDDGSAFIYSGDGEHIYTGGTGTAYKVKFVSNALEGAQGTDARIAVAEFSIVGSTFSNVANHVTALYVLDKVTVDAQSGAPGDGATPGEPAIIALGNVDLTESNSASFDDVNVNFVFTRDSVLTTSAPGSVTIGVPDGAALPTIKAAKPITVAGPVAISGLTIGKIEGPETVTVSGATSIAGLNIANVSESGTVAIGTTTLTAATIANNDGTVSIAAPTTVAVTVNKNNGEVNVNTTTFTGPLTVAPVVGVPGTGTNAGTITITSSATIVGNTAVTNNAADGVINLNAPTSITGTVTVATNSGKINYATPSIATGISTVTTNNGEINFTQDLTSTLANFLKVPSNKGVINFKGTLTAGVLGSATPADSIAGPGKVVFGGLATFNAATVIGSDTEFNAGLVKNTAGGLTLNGDVTLGYEQKITLLTATDLLTLGAGKRILLGTTPVLAAGSNPVVITPGAGTELAAGTEVPADTDDPETFVGNKALTLGGTAGTAAITVTSGELKVPGVLIVGTATGVTVGATGSLTLEDGGILGFSNAAAAGTFKVVFGDTQITGVNNVLARLTASGGPVTLAQNRISGSGSTLAVIPDIGQPAITVDPGTPAGGKTLTIAGANLDLYGGGSLVITGHGTANKVILANGQNPGKLTLGEDKLYSITNLAGKILECGTNDGTLSGNGVVLGDNEVLPTTVGELSATEAANLTITGLGVGVNVTFEAGVGVTN